MPTVPGASTALKYLRFLWYDMPAILSQSGKYIEASKCGLTRLLPYICANPDMLTARSASCEAAENGQLTTLQYLLDLEYAHTLDYIVYILTRACQGGQLNVLAYMLTYMQTRFDRDSIRIALTAMLIGFSLIVYGVDRGIAFGNITKIERSAKFLMEMLDAIRTIP